jgi:CBS domain-containing protein
MGGQVSIDGKRDSRPKRRQSSAGQIMDEKSVKDLMLPLNEYGVVNEDATLADALETLELAQSARAPGRQPPRAVLVLGGDGEIVGQLGHLDFLAALEPRYALLGSLETISRAGMTSQFMELMLESLSFWKGSLSELCRRSSAIRVRSVMRPVGHSLDLETPLTEAIHKMVLWQAVRVLVTQQGTVIGLLRLTDLFEEFAAHLKAVKQEEQP